MFWKRKNLIDVSVYISTNGKNVHYFEFNQNFINLQDEKTKAIFRGGVSLLDEADKQNHTFLKLLLTIFKNPYRDFEETFRNSNVFHFIY